MKLYITMIVMSAMAIILLILFCKVATERPWVVDKNEDKE